ncbi:MAG: OmpA family protein [Candidatus Binatia bacterium]
MRKGNRHSSYSVTSQEWVLGDVFAANQSPSYHQQYNRRQPLRKRSQHHFSTLSVATGVAILFHIALFIIAWKDIFPQTEARPSQTMTVEFIPEPPSSLSPVPDTSTRLQELQTFRASAVARTNALEQALTHTLGHQAAMAQRYVQEVAALKAEQTALAEQFATLNEENQELKSQLADERQQTTAIQQQLVQTQQRQEAQLLEIQEIYNRLVSSLQNEIAQKNIALHQAQGQLTVRILERVLFPSGQATLTPEGTQIIDKVGAVLEKISDQRLLVEGHTDNVPIGSALRSRFPTNWELSTARATEVVKYLLSHTRVPAQQLSAVGRADTLPVSSNATEEGRKLNRRIEIIVFPTGKFSSDTS